MILIFAPMTPAWADFARTMQSPAMTEMPAPLTSVALMAVSALQLIAMILTSARMKLVSAACANTLPFPAMMATSAPLIPAEPTVASQLR
jgi:hypothetical protein